MIRTARVDLHGQARVWLDELPEPAFPVVDIIDRTLGAGSSSISSVRRAGVEVLLPRGAHAFYGLLGAEFTPRSSGPLEIQVAISGTPELQLDRSLAVRSDDVRLGLPRQYSTSVLDGVSTTHETHRLGPGVVRFVRAAHGAVGSSRWLFERLAGVVVSLLASQTEMLSDEDLSELLRQSFR